NGRLDGILNADRTPQIDFWQTRRVYSPIQILEDERPVKPGKQSVELTLCNRYDFTNLRDLTAQWFLLRDGQPVTNRTFVVNLEPHRDMELSTVLDIPSDLADFDYTLQYQFSEPSGRVIYERVVRLRKDNWQKDFLSRMRDLKWDKQWRVTGEPLRAEISYRTYSFIVQLATPGWFLRTQDHNIRLITGGPFLHFGRRQPENVSSPIREASAWIVKDLWIDAKTMEKQGNAVEIRTHCRETDSPSHGESAQAQIDILSSAFGYTDIRFSIQPGARQSLQQAGLAFRIPPTLDSVSWLGDGPSPSYPGQSMLNSWGFYLFPITAVHPGNRSRVRLLSLCDKNGYGLGIVLLDEVRNIMFRQELYKRFTVKQLMIAPPATINYNTQMEAVMQIFEDSGAWNLPVVDDEKRYMGFVSKSKIFNSYRHVL
ncbi:MAG TPA: DUF4981 domain-containing protein, partial [Anaerohalosphaeraceae bacterium]|nr:DUF4981 domain-containing protein [Anaerohalosphaeraceae bacterium]